MSKRNKNILSLSIVTLLVIGILGISYAYFTANLSGIESASTLRMTAGQMLITFNGGPDIELKNIYPKDDEWTTKTFSLTATNTTDADMNYRLDFVITKNTFSNNALSYTLKSYNPDNNGVAVGAKTDTKIATGAHTDAIGTGKFVNADGEAHTYELSLFFLDTKTSQNADQGKEFTAHIEVIGIN